MKANGEDLQKYSKAIDKIQEGNDIMVDLFNELENLDPTIAFSEDVMENIKKAKSKYGDEEIDDKINSVIREMLSWLNLEDDKS